jgi:HEAT repeat protein
MRLRRRWVLTGVVLMMPLLLWGGYLGPALLRQERFYHGLPSSYWARAVRRWHRASSRRHQRSPAWFDAVMMYSGLRGEPAVLQGDPAAVPVLADLARNSDENVRWRAGRALARVGPAAKEAVPILLEVMHEKSLFVRSEAAEALVRIGPTRDEVMPTVLQLIARGQSGDWIAALAIFPLWRDDPGAAPLLIQAACHEDLSVRNLAVCRLGQGVFAARVRVEQVVPLLLEATRDHHYAVRQSAAEALGKIDPEAAARAGVQ